MNLWQEGDYYQVIGGRGKHCEWRVGGDSKRDQYDSLILRTAITQTFIFAILLFNLIFSNSNLNEKKMEIIILIKFNVRKQTTKKRWREKLKLLHLLD